MPSILVIDDKESMRTMLTDSLTEDGYQVDTAGNGKKALELARVKNFDLAITDLKMPDVDGLQVLSGLKDIDNDMSVIIMTAYGTVESAVAAMKNGAYDFITKPFDPDHLTVIIERALENRRLIAENSLLREELAQNLGFSEIITYSFISTDAVDILGPGENSPLRSFVRLLKPLTVDQSVMRTSLIPGLLSTVKSNSLHDER